MQLADELGKVKIEAHTPQLNPARQGTQNVALGRVRVEYAGKSKIVCPNNRSQRALRKLVVQMIDPSLNLNSCRGGRAKQLTESLTAQIRHTAQASLHAADLSKLQERASRAERTKITKAEAARRKRSVEEVRRVFKAYGDVLTEDVVMELWKETVVEVVLTS